MLPDPAEIEPATSLSPVGRVSDWSTEAGNTIIYSKSYTAYRRVVRVHNLGF